MLYTHARLRYLAVLGIPAVATSMVACSANGNGENTTPTATVAVGDPPVGTGTETTASEPVATATATETPSAEPTASATPTATPTGTALAQTWIPNDPRVTPPTKGPPTGRPLPMCPHGLVCTVAPASLDGAAAAPAPYAMCAAQTTLPDSAVGLPGRGVRTSFEPTVTKAERKKEGAACCYEWVRPCPGGRPFRSEYGEILAGATGRGDWLARVGSLGIVEEMGSREREMAAAHYEREAAFEHASVASFARASMGLLGLGAPADLVAEAHAAAIDEVEHARIAFALASAFRGERRGPSRLAVERQVAFPESLGELLAETFADACIGETVAALSLREAVSEAKDATIAGLLARIAEDEERHAALAWRTVAWALLAADECDDAARSEVRRALEAAIAGVRHELSAIVGTGAETSAGGATDLTACGILGESRLLDVRRRALEEVVLPCAEALLRSSGETRIASTNEVSLPA